MCAKAPEKRMISPWMTRTISRVTVLNSKSSSAPPWERAQKRSDAMTMPTGWLRPINATAMPVKP